MTHVFHIEYQFFCDVLFKTVAISISADETDSEAKHIQLLTQQQSITQTNPIVFG